MNWANAEVFTFCLQGPNFTYLDGHVCLELDGDGNNTVDLADFGMLQQFFTGGL